MHIYMSTSNLFLQLSQVFPWLLGRGSLSVTMGDEVGSNFHFEHILNTLCTNCTATVNQSALYGMLDPPSSPSG